MRFSTTTYFFFSWKEYGQGYHKQEVRWFDYCANDFRWALHISCWAAWSSKHPNCCCRQRPGYRKITHVEFYEMLISLYYCPVCQLYEKWVIPNHRWKSVWHVHKSFQIWKIDIIVKDFHFLGSMNTLEWMISWFLFSAPQVLDNWWCMAKLAPPRTHLITLADRITINTRFPVAQNLVEVTWSCTLFSASLWPFLSSCLSSLSRFYVGKIPTLMDTPWLLQVRYSFHKNSNFKRSYFKKVREQWNLIHTCLKWPFSFHIEVVGHSSCLGSLNHSKMTS